MASLEHSNNIKERVRIPFILNWLEGLLWAIILGYTLVYHYHIIIMDTPGELREGTPVSITRLLLEGKNPYDLENLPVFTYVYGIVYNLTILPVGIFTDPTLEIHRIASAIFLLLACGVMYLILKASKVSNVNSLRGAGLFYLLNCTTYSILARPDTLGVLLMLLTIYFVMTKSYGFSILMATLAFYTKPYFLFGLGVASIYIFFQKNLKSSTLYFISGILTLIVSAILINYAYPYYFIITLGIHQNDQMWEFGYFVEQLKYWGLSTGFLLLGSLLAARYINKETISWFLALAFSVLILSSGMGWHKGAFLIYYVHLATPFVILSFLSSKMPYLQSQLLLLGQLLLLVYLSYPLPKINTNFKDLSLKMQLEDCIPSCIATHNIKYLQKLKNNGQTVYTIRLLSSPKIATHQHLKSRINDYLSKFIKYDPDKIWTTAISIADGSNHNIEGVVAANIIENYKIKKEHEIFSYFGAFDMPSKYGKSFYLLLEWEKIK